MKRQLPILLYAIVAFVLCSFYLILNPVDTPVSQVKVTLFGNLKNLDKAVSELQTSVKNQTIQKNDNQLKEAFANAKLAYKDVEFLTAYIDPELCKDFINGAPLPKIERNSPDINILKPKGFQRIEELVYEEHTDQNLESLKSLTADLEKNVERISSVMHTQSLFDMHILEAIRFGLVRVFTLGVTGFENPASDNALSESSRAMMSMKESFMAYQIAFESVNKKVYQETIITFDKGIKQLDEGEFESFDRFDFLVECINPLYRNISILHQESGIEQWNEFSRQARPVNFKATNIFDVDFLDPYAFPTVPKNEDTEEVKDLGKTLFFDPALSASGERACASCHKPEMAFSDGRTKSLAMDFKGTTLRNSPGLINSVYAQRYFHDMRTQLLFDQMDHVLLSSKEFASDWFELQEKLEDSDEYVERFEKAFPKMPSPKINKYSISASLASYVTSLQGFNSEFDQYVRGEKEEIAPEIKNGFNLFMGKAACGTCHFAPNFSGIVPPFFDESESEVLGVPKQPKGPNQTIDPDLGRADAFMKERVPFYEFSFKTPTVRNAELTGPYMHNGVYETMEELMEFYNVGGGIGLGLDVPYQTLPPDSLGLTEREISDIISFMNSLTDTSSSNVGKISLPEFSSHPEWSDRKVGGVY